jgi:hypothetical protein
MANEERPYGFWTAEGFPDAWTQPQFEKDIRPTLRVARELHRSRAYAGGTWWTWESFEAEDGVNAEIA